MSPTDRDTVANSLPGVFWAGGFLLAGLMAFTAWDQSHWWRLKDDYVFGWLVPVFVAYVCHDRWPRLRPMLTGMISDGVAAGWERVVAWSVLAVSALVFLVGAFYRAAAGATYSGTLAITVGMAGLVLASAGLLVPPTSRRRVILILLFPALVWLVSAPMITVVENNLNVFLMGRVTAVVFFVFDALGLALEQRGNVLVLPTGNVGVAEACSGIRSLTGCVFAGSFLAAVFLDTWWRKAALLFAALLMAFVANLLRSIFLTSWAYHHGVASIEGKVHDVSGFAVLGLTVVVLLCLLPLFTSRGGPRMGSTEKSSA